MTRFLLNPALGRGNFEICEVVLADDPSAAQITAYEDAVAALYGVAV